MKVVHVTLPVLLFLLTLPISADSWSPFRDQRVVSPTGRTYVVLRLDKKTFGLRYELCRRRSGAAPMKPAIERDDSSLFNRGKSPGEPIDRDPNDLLIAEGHVQHYSMRVRVLLLEDGQTADYRGGAAHVLGMVGSPKEIDVLLKATATAPNYVANAAVNAAIDIGAPDLGQRLAKILEKGSTQDSRIAAYFLENPAVYALEPVERALARHPRDMSIKQTLEAIRAIETES